MIIISKFHDFYDSGMSYGIDKTLRYIRKTEEIDQLRETPKNLIEILRDLPDVYDIWDKNFHDFSARPFIIILCGKVHLGYHCFNLKDFSKKNGSLFLTVPDIYVYDLLSLERVMKKYHADGYDRFYEKSRYSFNRISFKHEDIGKAFEEFKEKEIDIGFHIDEKAPVMYLGHKGRNFFYVKNPLLRELQFYKKKNAFQVFQEISMFVGGVASKIFPPTVELSEKDRIEKSGFDKWSFRKMGKNPKK